MQFSKLATGLTKHFLKPKVQFSQIKSKNARRPINKNPEGFIGMRGTRRPVEAQTGETPLGAPAPLPNPEFLTKKIFDGDEQSNKKLYDEFIKDFHEIGDHYNKHNLFVAKTALVELLNRMKDQGFSKTELTVRILEVLADINLKVR
jgi:hypothetical protein